MVGGLIGVACALTLAFSGAPNALADTPVTRLGGKDRYETMEQICKTGFEHSGWACVATGENFPDALAASSLAGMRDAPILLTRTSELTGQTRAELVRLQVHDVLLLGGPNAVSRDVEYAIQALGIGVHRIEGKDRFETSLEIMRATRKAGSESDTVILTTGDNFADSLSVGPYAYDAGAPIVLTRNRKLTNAAVDAIHHDAKIRNVLIVGGTAVVSDDVERQLGDGYTYRRVSGPDRYRTSAAIANWECGQALSWKAPSIATGMKFPDALAGAAVCGARRSPILLVSDDSNVGLGVLATHADEVEALYVLGGPKAVSTTTQALAEWICEVEAD